MNSYAFLSQSTYLFWSRFTHFFRTFFETENQNPQTLSLLECMELGEVGEEGEVGEVGEICDVGEW